MLFVFCNLRLGNLIAVFTRIFAEFHAHSGKYKEATLSVIMAMYYLHKDMKKPRIEEYPELDNHRFINLYKEAQKYYKIFCDER